MGDINVSYEWAIQMCNRSNVGYSQAYRQGQTVGGITYFDCSSFISAACYAGGFFDTNPWFTTETMGTYLLEAGFTRLDPSVDWLPGDILVVNSSTQQHTEMVYLDRRTMGAHSSNLPITDQVSILTNDSTVAWEDLYRYGGGASGTYNWIFYDVDTLGNMSTADMQNNALIMYSLLLTQYGWTLPAIAGALGNMHSESYFNPAQWEAGHKPDPVPTDGYGFGYGYGLIQWTRPGADYPNPYLNYCGLNNIDRLDGTEQIKYLNTGITTSDLWGWIPTSTYPMSFDQYKVSTLTPEELALVWYYNLERPPEGDTSGPVRQTHARLWYDYLYGRDPITPGPGPSPGRRKNKDWWCFKI